MIVKNLMAVGVIAGFTSAAVAAEGSKADWKISGKVRVDAVQTSTETKNGDADKTTSKKSEMKLYRGQIKLVGTQGSDTMEMVVKGEKIGSSNNDALDTATITHKFTDMFSASFGKMAVLAQSVENDYSSADMYLYSMANNYTPSNATGIQLGASFGDHSLALQVVQGTSSFESENAADGNTTSGAFESKGGLTTALQYKGNINKMIKPIVTYTAVKPAGTKTKLTTVDGDNKVVGTDTEAKFDAGINTQIGLGVQVDIAGATIDVEYDMVTLAKYKALVAGEYTSEGIKEGKINSVVFQAKYAIGVTSPFLKVTSDSAKFGADESVGDITGMNLGLGVEHKLDDSCRLHAVYTNKATSTKIVGSKTKKETETGFNFGVTASI